LTFLPVYKFFFNLEINGGKNIENLKGPLILAVNHTSELDPTVIPLVFPFLSGHLPIYSVVQPVERFRHYVFKWRRYIYTKFFFNILGGYSSHSGSKNYAISLVDHIELLKQGKTVCIFPEGERTRDGKIGEAHGGLAFLVNETNATVLPISINTFYNVSFTDFILRRKKIVVTVLPAIYKKQIIPEINPTVEDFRKGSQVVLDRIKKVFKTNYNYTKTKKYYTLIES
jgi:1-acyl-sn-glycerol-3-phosphate acyltransferase